MTETPQLSGKDLARQALAAYKATARTAPTAGPSRTGRKRATRRGDGRDPITLAAAITALGADLPLKAGVAGGSLLDRWPELCPQYAGCVEPAGYDEHTGRLDLRPASHAYAAQLRLLGGQLAKQINDKMGRSVVRTIRVLPVGHVGTPQPVTAAPGQDEDLGPVRTRETAHPGYRQTLAAVFEHRPEKTPTNPYVLEAITRQEQALRANRQPEPAAELDQAPARQVDRSESVRRAALARKRQEASGTEPRQLFGAA